MQFEFFDPHGDIYVHYRRLPHWEQAGAICFVTWRTIDSIPADVLRRWRVERAMWLRQRGIDPLAQAWRDQLRLLPPAVRKDYHERFTSRWMECLDEGHGACVLKRPELSAIVAESLLYYDGKKYAVSDFVVMPNHVHLLAQFQNDGQMKRQCKAWKHYTAGRINRVLGTEGRFWQVESFDHLVRSVEQFEYLRAYIERNPTAARLRNGEYRHYRRPRESCPLTQ
jgi:putative transposase